MDYHSDGKANPAGGVEDVFAPDIGATRVSHDMEGIFGAARPLPDEEASPNSPAINPIVARARDGRTGRSRVERTLALSGLVIACALAASIFVVQHGSSNPEPSRVAKSLPPLASQMAQADRVPALVQPQAIPVAPTSLAGEHATKTSAAAAPRPRPSVAVYHPKRTSTPRLAKRAVTKVHRSRERTPRLAAVSAASAPSSPAREACHRLGGLDLARCMRPQILDADQELRNAYYDATRAGVDRRELSAYRRQWSRLRKQANSDPRGVEFGYRQMAKQLDAARTVRFADGN
jgi:hypothetical protein